MLRHSLHFNIWRMLLYLSKSITRDKDIPFNSFDSDSFKSSLTSDLSKGNSFKTSFISLLFYSCMYEKRCPNLF